MASFLRLPTSRCVLTLAAFATACDTTEVATPAAPPAALAFTNGPSELPHVLRFEQRTIAGWVDFDRNTGIILGAPTPPELSRLCGGSLRNEFVPIQFVGELDGVVKELLLDQDVSVLVYDEIAPTLLDALCGSEPAGAGRGFYLRSDNDFFGTGGQRANGFSDHVHAEVTLQGGGAARVNAYIHGVGLDGALFTADASVMIQPTGGG